MPAFFHEEERSRQPSLFSVLRKLNETLGSPEDEHLGFYGAFGYDLVFQFEPIDLRHEREGLLDAHLFFPDQVVVVDRRLERAYCCEYDFALETSNTQGLDRQAPEHSSHHTKGQNQQNDHQGDEYAEKVKKVQEGCRRGDFFEVVLSQTFSQAFQGSSVELFRRFQRENPSPYEFIIHMGDEQLVGASPEMFVRVEGSRVETCPISGTAARGETPMEDADQVRWLLSSDKEEAELTMCTDVDRNDKSRVCDPQTIKVLGRRMIELYSKVIHTVDHVEGQLKKGRDGLDAFLAHLWAVTLSGAPKAAAMQKIEDLENSARGWYGGAVGTVLLNGNINTGITIRTVNLKAGTAKLRVGATLLAESDPIAEQNETRLKAQAFLNALSREQQGDTPDTTISFTGGVGKKVLFVDHRDSFVHTLAGYVRRTGAEVLTLRSGFPEEEIDAFKPDLIFLSPGPARPIDFGLPAFIRRMMDRKIPMFGVCLGLQGMAEALGGELGILPKPHHGVRALIHHQGLGVFQGLPAPLTASRYHSLYAIKEKLPDCFEITASSEDGIIMGLRHKDYPMEAIQFHPESIHALKAEAGLTLINNMMKGLSTR